MVPWWLPVDLPNISAITDRLETWLVPIERSFQGLSVAIETVRIDGELMEIWPNEVCDRHRPLLEGSTATWHTTVQITSEEREQSNLTYNLQTDCGHTVVGRKHNDLTYNSANYQWRKGAQRSDIQFAN